MLLSSCNNDTAKTTTSEKSSSFNIDSVKAVIAASNKKFGEAWASGDSATFVSCYAKDACINPPNMPRMCGPAAITGFFNGGRAMGLRNLTLTTEEVMGGNEAVVETGKYEVFDSAHKSLDKGKYLVMWKEEDGKWKSFRDEWNSDQPAIIAMK